jgi:assimilatory nitrate reductase catalytic subunit
MSAVIAIDTSTAALPVTEQQTTCCYCGVGCGVTAQLQGDKVIAVKGREDHPANFGRLCVKGSALHQTQGSPDRLLQPQLHGQTVSWDAALDYGARRFRDIIDTHGPDAVAFYLSGQLLTEDYYVANKLLKGFIGTANVDTNSRLCMASAVVAHKRALGGDAVPGCYEDLEQADLLILVGSNTAYAHPVIFQRIAKARAERPEMTIVVIDPRRTATCEIADIHLPLAPGSDGYFFNGLLAYLAREGALDQDFIDHSTEGFAAALTAASAQMPSTAAVAAQCDLPEAAVEAVFKRFATTSKVVTVFSMGINQSSSGVDKGNAIINCHLATGKIGKPGACPFSITGQPNAMGGREVGGLANQLAAHMGFEKPEDIARVERFWQAPRMARQNGLKAVDMFEAVAAGRIKAIWIMATNPVVSMPDADAVKAALAQCELVIVSEAIGNTDTAKFAHLLLPATTWSEKQGTVTNSERCMSLQKGMIPPPGEARHDWDILCDFARRMGFDQGFNYRHPVEIFREHAALSGLDNRGTRAFDISGLETISREDYENFQPIQWPVNADYPKGRARLFTDGYFVTDSRKARFVAVTARLPAQPAKAGEMIMNTGRIRDQWHTMSRTGTAPHLLSHSEEPYIDVHPDDAARLGVKAGHLLVLHNRGTQYIGRAKPNANQRRGEVFVPMHWNAKYAAWGRADALVNPYIDPFSGQPEYKQVPVSVKAFDAAWQATLLTQQDLEWSDLAAATHTSTPDYWAKITLAAGFKYRLASRGSRDLLAWVKSLFPAITDWQILRDNRAQSVRAVGLVQGLCSVLFQAETGPSAPVDLPWWASQLGETPDAASRYALLAGQPVDAVEDPGAIVCACFQVGSRAIEAAIASGCASAEALGQTLKCGTNCGSCVPELSAMVRAHQAQSAA